MYELNFPRHIVFGWEGVAQLPRLAELVAGKAGPAYVLVTGASPRSQTSVATATELLGAPAAVFNGVRPEPLLSHVDGLAELLRTARPDLVIGIGGGSVLDVAKAGAILAPTTGDAADYFHARREISAPGIPFIALPTTAGTGAEITKNSVLTDPDAGIKKSIRHPYMVAAAAIIDPALTLTMSRAVTAASGLDALTQAVESYLSRGANAATLALARQATVLMLPALPAACIDGADRNARAAMAEGSLLAAMAFAQSGLGAVHALAHPLGAALKLAHGYTCAVLLPHILAYNADAAAKRLAELARAAGLESGAELVQAIADLCAELGIPGSLAGDGLTAAHFPSILQHCRSNSMRFNPREMSDDDVLGVLAKLAAE